MLLIGADPALAAACGAQGVHLPERLAFLAPRLRHARPHWRITCAAHSTSALHKAWNARVDAALLSPVFSSSSASARAVRPFGPTRFAALVRAARLPVYALGGLDLPNAARLDAAWGVAAVEALAGDG